MESKSLIQKAHELYNVNNIGKSAGEKVAAAYKTPEKVATNQQISLADRAARIN